METELGPFFGILSGCLETFLGGMETPGPKSSLATEPPLETFLGGMETARPPSPMPSDVAPLKPSLVEWKLSPDPAPSAPFAPLKPSLVEWKPAIPTAYFPCRICLETFLGGMETGEVPRPRDGR